MTFWLPVSDATFLGPEEAFCVGYTKMEGKKDKGKAKQALVTRVEPGPDQML